MIESENYQPKAPQHEKNKVCEAIQYSLV